MRSGGETGRSSRASSSVPIDADAQIDALANGEIDMLDIGPDVNKYVRAKELAGTDIRVAGGPNFRHVTINGTGPILRDVKVRQAVAMAIDRAAITRAMLGPLGIETVTLGNHIFMRNQRGYRDNSGDIGKYDPARAAQLLDEAGWKLEGNVRRKDGRVLEITCVIPAAVATSRQESELIQNMLGQVGVRLTINTVPSPDFFEKYVRPGQFDFTIFSWIGTPFPISSQSSRSTPSRCRDRAANSPFSRTTRASAPTRSIGSSTRPPQSSIGTRRPSWPIASTR